MGTRVLYILGTSRCGSTILDNILGELPGFLSVGEFRFLWERLEQRRRCGCGASVNECEFWKQVLETAFEGCSAIPKPLEVVEWQRKTARMKHTWRLLRETPDAVSGSEPLARYLRLIERVYQAAAQVSGAQVIVDSSKWPASGALLPLIPGVEPYFVHMVRDPRAVAYSQLRRKANLDRDQPAEMPRVGPVMNAIHWMVVNLAAEAVRRRGSEGESFVLRYEDFIARPLETIKGIAGFTGKNPRELPFVDERTVELGVNHTVSGNPRRFARGRVELRPDDEWASRLSTKDRFVTNVLLAPLMPRYGYSISLRSRASPLRRMR